MALFTQLAAGRADAATMLLDPKNDLVFQLLLTRAPELARHMTEALLGRRVESVQIVDPEPASEQVDDKRVRFDVRVRVNDGTRGDFEMQLGISVGLKPRLLYYWAYEFTSQLASGEDYTLLKPTFIAMWTPGTLFPEIEELQAVFELVHRKRNIRYSEQLQIHVLQLGMLHFEPDPKDPLVQWGRFFAAQTRAEYARLAAESPIMDLAKKTLEQISQNPEAARRARHRVAEQYFQREALRESREAGIAEGKAEGMREMVRSLLAQRFGALPVAVRQRLARASDAQLTRVGAAVLGAESLEHAIATLDE